MKVFEAFENGKLALPEKGEKFGEMAWIKHPVFEGVEQKNIITAKDTDGKFSYHLVHIAPNCSIGEHIHKTQLETHAGAVLSFKKGYFSFFLFNNRKY